MNILLVCKCVYSGDVEGMGINDAGMEWGRGQMLQAWGQVFGWEMGMGVNCCPRVTTQHTGSDKYAWNMKNLLLLTRVVSLQCFDIVGWGQEEEHPVCKKNWMMTCTVCTYMAVFGPWTQPCKWPMYTGIEAVYMPCLWPVPVFTDMAV